MSGRKFSLVSPALWRPGRFLSLTSSDAKVLHLYLLTSDHQTSAGCFRLPDGYACADLHWPMEQYQAARDALIEAGLIMADRETAEIYIERWFNHCPPTNEKHAAGTRRLIEEIESDTIREKVENDYIAADDARRQSRDAQVTPINQPSHALLNSKLAKQSWP
jgi:hypothetical protein